MRFTIPRHPVYIISKNRAEYMMTSKALVHLRIPHYIAIEPHNLKAYQESLNTFNLHPYVTLLVLPFENHGDGPGRARNWCWDHSISIGAEKHWVLDDNIKDFLRLHQNKKYRVESGAMFRAAEDFIDRFENVPISGFNYEFFVPKGERRACFNKNTRIYSCLLISNDCKYKWRGRYNEDTDLSLRVLKDGDCTIQFNCFLQRKAGTQTLKGGNTEEFYAVELADAVNEEQRKDLKEKLRAHYIAGVNPTGTKNKTQMLVNMHPDVTKAVWKYGRLHHFVDYTPFQKNKLRYKKNYTPPKGIDEYGMRLIELKDDEALKEYLENKPHFSVWR